MEKRPLPEQSAVLAADPLPHVLGCRGVAYEGGRHPESPGRDVTHDGLHVVGEPLHKVGAVLVLDVVHLLFHFLYLYMIE